MAWDASAGASYTARNVARRVVGFGRVGYEPRRDMRTERFVVAVLVSAAAGLVAYVGLRGLRVAPLVAAPMVVALVAAGVVWLARRLPTALDGLARRRPWMSAAWLLLALVAVVQTARLSAFMLDPAQAQHSVFPGDPWYVEHCCLTAYAESARLAGGGEPNVYAPGHYAERRLGSFRVDLYHYPPPFLLLPLGAQAATGGSFEGVRALWFGVSGLALMLALGLVAWRLEPRARLRAIGMAPVVWCSLPVQLGLQMSNYQVLVVSISALAFVALPRRAAVGGALLATGAVSKIFPGILLVYLAARRRWREVGWTAACAAGFCALAFAVLGPVPFRAFVEFELPRLSSGEAFAVPFSRGFAVARNMAPFGLPLKLGWLGVPEMSLAAGRAVSVVYGLGVVGLAVWAARRPPRSNAEAAAVWLALLSLGTLASPFAPASYVLVSVVWLVGIARELFRPWAVAAVWVLTSGPFLFSLSDVFWVQLLLYLPAQVLALAVPALVLYRAGAGQPRVQTQDARAAPALA